VIRREPPKEIETAIGTIRLTVGKTPFVEQVDKRPVTGEDIMYFVSILSGETNKSLGFALVCRDGASGADTAQILSFFPFKFATDGEKYKKHGIGNALLKQIVEDCKSDGVRLVYVVSRVHEMQNLLRKFGFVSPQPDLFNLDLLRNS
jgi:GNAT superfamily N-acetyltransferase